MSKRGLNFFLGLLCSLLIIGIGISTRYNRQLVHEKEVLILKNDSLHIQQIKIRNELETVQNNLDSVMKWKGRKFFTFK